MNFKKNGIFGRREDGGQREAEYDGYGSPNQVLAVWGSPGSGKTTVAVKLAKYLAGKKKNVILLLCDMTAPMLPCRRTGMRAFPGQRSGGGAGVGIPGEAQPGHS